MENYATIRRLTHQHLVRHGMRSAIDGLISRFQKDKLPEMHEYLGFPDETLINYLERKQGLLPFEMTDTEKKRFSDEIMTSLESCSDDNPIRSFPNPKPIVEAIAVLDEFEKNHQDQLHCFVGYDNGVSGLSLSDLEQQLKDRHMLFCHRISDRLNRAFWTLPCDLIVSMTRLPSNERMVGGWELKAWLAQREGVVCQLEGVLTTAFFDGLSKQDVVQGFSEFGDYMKRLGVAIAHEIGRNALPFSTFDDLYGDEDDNVTGCLHIQRIETRHENQQLGYARTLILGVGEAIRSMNEFDVVTQQENGWKIEDHTTYNPVIKSCHNSMVHKIAANRLTLTTVSDPVSVMIEELVESKKPCHGAALSEAIAEGAVLKNEFSKMSKVCAQGGRSPLGECWVFYPEWIAEEDYTTPAGVLA